MYYFFGFYYTPLKIYNTRVCYTDLLKMQYYWWEKKKNRRDKLYNKYEVCYEIFAFFKRQKPAWTLKIEQNFMRRIIRPYGFI